MSRANYSNEPTPPSYDDEVLISPRPTVLTDGTPLLHDNPCPNCSTKNRRAAYRCFHCYSWLRTPPKREKSPILNELMTYTWWELCFYLPLYGFFALLRLLKW